MPSAAMQSWSYGAASNVVLKSGIEIPGHVDERPARDGYYKCSLCGAGLKAEIQDCGKGETGGEDLNGEHGVVGRAKVLCGHPRSA